MIAASGMTRPAAADWLAANLARLSEQAAQGEGEAA